MKTIFAIVLLSVNAAEAFVPAARFGTGSVRVRSSALNAESADEAIKAALEASKTHGPTSKEARYVKNVIAN